MSIIAINQSVNNTDNIYIYKGCEPDSYAIETQGHLVKVQGQGGEIKGGGKRGKVHGYSKQSRKRMQETLARLEPRAETGSRSVALFLTLTYAGKESELPTPALCKTHLDTFFKAVGRRFPHASGIWRFEWDSSGQRQYHPHFHILLFGVRFWNHRDVRELWNRVSGNPEGSSSEKVTAMRSWRGAMSYLSKYMTKDLTSPLALSPSASGRASRGPYRGAAAPAGDVPEITVRWLVYDTYLTGRVWGIYNRDALPWGELMLVTVEKGHWYHNFKRIARRKWAGVNKNRWIGFSLFSDSPNEWVRLLLLVT